MTRGVVVLRPEPGNGVTAARAEALGLAVVRRPLFAVAPVVWVPPDPAEFDAMLVTSANAVRHAGPDLVALAALPVVAVGAASAAAAREAGLSVAVVGDGDAAAAVAAARSAGFLRPLHLAGRDRRDVGVPTVTVYDSAALPIPSAATAAWEGQVLLLHSPRAARRAAGLVDRDARRRGTIALAAISAAAHRAAGEGWRAAAVAVSPTDAALLAAAARLTSGTEAGISEA